MYGYSIDLPSCLVFTSDTEGFYLLGYSTLCKVVGGASVAMLSFPWIFTAPPDVHWKTLSMVCSGGPWHSCRTKSPGGLWWVPPPSRLPVGSFPSAGRHSGPHWWPLPLPAPLLLHTV